MEISLSSTGAARKVMVVADPGRESAGALQWALSHALVEHDKLILLHVESNSRRYHFSTFLKRPSTTMMVAVATAGSSADAGGDYGFLDKMRIKCEAAQPKVQVQIEKVEMEGRDKASTILLQTNIFSIDLLVIGQHTSTHTFLGRKLSGSLLNKGMDTAEYLIEHSKCLCVGVQKKGQKAGYLLNTKTHRNFWLLA